MKVLLLTGLQAEALIRKNLEKYTEHEVYLKTLPIPIAAFMTPKLITYHIKKENIFYSINSNNTTVIDNIDIILTPGLMKQDTTYIQKQLKIPTYKGPSNAADIKITLDILNKMTLSTTKAADILIKDKQYQEIMNIINDYQKDNPKSIELLKKEGNFTINNCTFGIDFPMRILGEIANASDLTEEELLKKSEILC